MNILITNGLSLSTDREDSIEEIAELKNNDSKFLNPRVFLDKDAVRGGMNAEILLV
jgi:hypothetical protein